MSYQNYETLLFDLDGTLIDSSGDLADTLNHTLREDGFPALDLDQVVAMVGDGAAALVARGYGHYDEKPPSDALRRYRQRYSEHCLDRTRPYDGIPELLARLAPKRTLAVVTNKPTEFARKVVTGLGLDPLFATVVGPELASAPKPSPAPVLTTLETIGRRPQDAVMIGDTSTDILAGRRAGTATIAVTWGFRRREQIVGSEPGLLVETVDDLARAIE